MEQSEADVEFCDVQDYPEAFNHTHFSEQLF